MVIDSSVIISIALLEPGAKELADRLFAARPIMAAPTVLEANMVLSSRAGPSGRQLLDDAFQTFAIDVVPFNQDHLQVAKDCFDRYGKGRHPAALNFGDCMSYALSKVSGQPLLFVGSDFDKTDVCIA